MHSSPHTIHSAQGRPALRRPTLRTSRNHGFTLVEMIVSLAVFSIVAVVALGALVKIVSANKKAQSLQSSISSLNFVLDAMSRDLIAGSKYWCESNSGNYNYKGNNLSNKKCPSGSITNNTNPATLAFKSSKKISGTTPVSCNAAYAYRFRPNNGTYIFEKAQQTTCDEGINNDDDFTPIVDPSVTITGYYIAVPENDPIKYPRVTIRISGYTGVRERDKTYFDVQTTVSARVNI